MKLRIWCETVSVETVASRAVTSLLGRHGVDPIVAVQPGGEGRLPACLGRMREAGLRPAIWPMLDDGAGRWGSAWNARAFTRWVMAAARAAGPAGNPGLEVVFDLEPPIALVASVVSGAWRKRLGRECARPRLSRGRIFDAHAELAAAVEALQQAGYRALAAVAPMVLVDTPARANRVGGWQTLLGTPVEGIPWDGVQVMAYSSILQGWSLGALPRRGALSIVRRASGEAVRRYGSAAGVSLGAVGTGAFGDEPVYADAGELAEDVAQARAGGVQDLALFELGGVLARRDGDAWLEALHTPPTMDAAPRSLRGMALWRSTAGVARAVECWQRVVRRGEEDSPWRRRADGC